MPESNSMRRTLKDFPGPRPKPHEMKAFLDDADEVIGLNGLTAVANGKLPTRVATLYSYSAELTAPVPVDARAEGPLCSWILLRALPRQLFPVLWRRGSDKGPSQGPRVASRHTEEN